MEFVDGSIADLRVVNYEIKRLKQYQVDSSNTKTDIHDDIYHKFGDEMNAKLDKLPPEVRGEFDSELLEILLDGRVRETLGDKQVFFISLSKLREFDKNIPTTVTIKNSNYEFNHLPCTMLHDMSSVIDTSEMKRVREI